MNMLQWRWVVRFRGNECNHDVINVRAITCRWGCEDSATLYRPLAPVIRKCQWRMLMNVSWREVGPTQPSQPAQLMPCPFSAHAPPSGLPRTGTTMTPTNIFEKKAWHDCGLAILDSTRSGLSTGFLRLKTLVIPIKVGPRLDQQQVRVVPFDSLSKLVGVMVVRFRS